eukprot:1159418-Pelagomonas_calceolata.AAC.5
MRGISASEHLQTGLITSTQASAELSSWAGRHELKKTFPSLLSNQPESQSARIPGCMPSSNIPSIFPLFEEAPLAGDNTTREQTHVSSSTDSTTREQAASQEHRHHNKSSNAITRAQTPP